MMTNTELIDSIMEDCNKSVRALVSGQHLLWCALMAGITQKLNHLKNGVESEARNRDETIETLKTELRNAGRNVEDMPPAEFIKRWKDGLQND